MHTENVITLHVENASLKSFLSTSFPAWKRWKRKEYKYMAASRK